MRIGVAAKFFWFDRPVAQSLHPKVRKYLARSGAFAMRTARRLLRPARKVRLAELSDDDREQYLEDVEDYHNGYSDKLPRLPDIISSPGKPPLTHTKPSPLKHGIFFALKPGDEPSVVVGPIRSGDAIAGDLEFGRGKIKQPRPFMGPAFQQTQPHLPRLFQSAVR